MRIVAFLLVLLVAWPAHSSTIETYAFDDAKQEEQYKRLIDELRCLVCQNQNLADSNAELAQDMRRKTFEMVKAGKSEAEVVDYMVQRYGDFVMYRPPFRSNTMLLWIGPFIILIVGVLILIRFIRRKPATGQAAHLSDEDKARAEKLLDSEGDNK